MCAMRLFGERRDENSQNKKKNFNNNILWKLFNLPLGGIIHSWTLTVRDV